VNRIAFIGGGNMARALISGLQLSDGWSIHVVDSDEPTCQTLVRDFGCTASGEIDSRVREVDLLVFAVKPNVMKSVCLEVGHLPSKQIALSVAAGIETARISDWLGVHKKVARAIPNTPVLARQGMTGLYATKDVGDSDRRVLSDLFNAVGKTLWCDTEDTIDQVTAVSGSGPAYVFYFIEAMIQAAKQIGFEERNASTLAMQTLRGAVALLEASGESPELLRERVTSKGGTTAAAIGTLETRGVMLAIVEAVQAARDRAIDIRTEFGN